MLQLNTITFGLLYYYNKKKIIQDHMYFNMHEEQIMNKKVHLLEFLNHFMRLGLFLVPRANF